MIEAIEAPKNGGWTVERGSRHEGAATGVPTLPARGLVGPLRAGARGSASHSLMTLPRMLFEQNASPFGVPLLS
jgi:hypothetical protein